MYNSNMLRHADIISTSGGTSLMRMNLDEGNQPISQVWRWRVDENGWVNWPDFQWRIYKNHPKIQWVNKVHEVLTGYEHYSDLHAVEEFALYHPKDIEKQVKQNNYYDIYNKPPEIPYQYITSQDLSNKSDDSQEFKMDLLFEDEDSDNKSPPPVQRKKITICVL